MMYKPQLSRRQKKLAYTDEQTRFLIKNSKSITAEDISEMPLFDSRTAKQIKDQCSRIGCGYISRKDAA